MPLIQRKAKLNDFLIGTATGHSKPHPTQAVRNCMFHSCSSKLGFHLSDGTHNSLCAYHAEKVRPKQKTTTVLYKSGPRKGQVKSKTVEILRKGGWKLRVFKFSIDRVLSFKQHARHFEIVLK